MPQPLSLQTSVALGTRSHPENRGATSSVQDPTAPDRSARHYALDVFSTVRGYLPAGSAEMSEHGFMHLPSTTIGWPTQLPQRLHHVVVVLMLLFVLPGAAQPPHPTPQPSEPWAWPVDGERRVIEPFRAPSHEYGPGHRGIDLAAGAGAVVHAPADGVVAFRGVVVDRPLITIDHGGGIVTTFEPVDSMLDPGVVVSAGDEIGTIASGGHSPDGQLHLGVRHNGVYINPMLMFGDVARAILLPCCQ